MNKVYRVFLSSVKRGFEKDRKMLTDLIVDNGMLPVEMEMFNDSTDKKALDVVKEKIKQCDVVLGVASFLYGSIVDQEKSNCELKKCNKCKKGKGKCKIRGKGKYKCVISYTEYEWRYALQNNIPYYYIVNQEYAKIDKLTDYLKAKKYDETCFKEIQEEFERQKESNKAFINDIDRQFRQEYNASNPDDLKSKATKVLSEIKSKIDLRGLIVAPRACAPISYEDYISNYLLLAIRNGLLTHLGAEEIDSTSYNGIRCVMAYYYKNENGKEKRMTIFDLPKHGRYAESIKDKNSGVVGLMNARIKKQSAIRQFGVIYDFEKAGLYYLNRDNRVEKEKVKRDVAMKGLNNNDNCKALIAIPIIDNDKVIGALTFDLSNEVRSYLVKEDNCLDETKIPQLLKRCKSYANVVKPFFYTYVYSEYVFLKNL